ncbi:MAG: Probable signal peptide protein [uncultured Caballeronia sp.]|nr:MAG: Probable signal peptide protein [uncultured Caballeronia sp.]
MNKIKSIWILTGIAGLCLARISGFAHAADVRLGGSTLVGVPAPVYVAPQPYYAPLPPVVYQPALVYVQPGLVIGWYSNRYYDGRRYWGRDEWYRHHGGRPNYGPSYGHGGPGYGGHGGYGGNYGHGGNNGHRN